MALYYGVPADRRLGPRLWKRFQPGLKLGGKELCLMLFSACRSSLPDAASINDP
jgi:hypothetical protein